MKMIVKGLVIKLWCAVGDHFVCIGTQANAVTVSCNVMRVQQGHAVEFRLYLHKTGVPQA